jgi:hypothetical protein
MTADEIPPWEHRRNSDPDTSRAAAERLSTAKTMMRRLLPAYLYCDCTGEESAAFAGYEHHAAQKRVSDLERLELIEDTGERRPGSSGRLQKICRITDKGREALGA